MSYRLPAIATLIVALTLGVSLGYVVIAKTVEAIGVATIANTPLPDLTQAPSQSTQIYDRTGQLLYQVGSVHRVLISIKDVPVPVKNAFLAAEDKSFYTNPGFSLRSIARAINADVSQDQLLQGGSTITQQLAQKLVVTKEGTLWRKVREIAVSVALTQKYSKDQILERYLNEVPVGGDLVGIGTAAEVYFGVPVNKLTTAQGAYIAALINAPSTLDPYLNPAGLKDRQQLVLSRMKQFGFLSAAEYNQAKNQSVSFKPRQTILKYPFFSFYVRSLLEQKFGATAVNQGLTVVTTLDPTLEDQAQTIVTQQIQTNGKSWDASNASLLAANPQTGQILAYVGGVDFSQSQVDINTSHRQPGSTIKPLTYYTAFAQGYSPETMALDAVEDFGGGYRPTDYGNTSSGKYVSLKVALAESLNIPAVRVFRGVGISTALQNMSLMGFPVIDGYHYTLPVGLGAVEVSPLDMTQAYATLANGGKQISVSPLLKVTDSHGKVLVDNTSTMATKQILDANAVAGVTSIISDYQLKKSIYAGAYFANYTLADRPAAAKTGTSSGPKDVWTIGYTPSLLTTVWAGNTSGANLKGDADGINVAAPIWHQFMTAALAGTPVEQFPTYNKPKLDADHRYIDRHPAVVTSPTPTSTEPTVLPSPNP